MNLEYLRFIYHFVGGRGGDGGYFSCWCSGRDEMVVSQNKWTPFRPPNYYNP